MNGTFLNKKNKNDSDERLKPVKTFVFHSSVATTYYLVGLDSIGDTKH